MVGGCAGGSGGAWGQQAPDCPACTLGFNPRWGQTLQFQLRAPELVLVRFVVEDYDTTSPNDFVGQFTLPLNSLKQGGCGWKGRGSGPPSPVHLGPGCPLRACPEPSPEVGGGLCPHGPGPEGLGVGVGRELDTWLPSPQGTATSTCFPRTAPHCHQPRSSSTSASSASEGGTTHAGAPWVPACLLWQRLCSPQEWGGAGRTSPSSLLALPTPLSGPSGALGAALVPLENGPPLCPMTPEP